MKVHVGLSIIMMIVCFNLALMITSSLGLYDMNSAYANEQQMQGITAYSSGLSLQVLISGGFGALVGLGISKLAGGSVDTLRAIGISSVTTILIPLWANSYNILTQLANSIGGSTASGIISIVIIFQILMVLIFVLQLATGGWLSVK